MTVTTAILAQSDIDPFITGKTDIASVTALLGTSGLTPPNPSQGASFRNSFDVSGFPGVVVGTGVGVAQSILAANLTALQAALDFCAASNYYAYFPAGRYAIYGGGVDTSTNTGLQAKPNLRGVIGYGIGDVIFEQWHPDHPVVTLGGLGATNTYSAQYANFSVENRVNGSATSRGILFGSHRGMRLDNVTVNRVNTSTMPSIGVSFQSNYGFFSNIINSLSVYAGQLRLIDLAIGSGTGNVWNNTYLGGGGQIGTSGGPGVTCSDVALSANGAGFQNVFNQLNIEWVAAFNLIKIQNSFGFVFNSLHIEGCATVGNNAALFYAYGQSRAVFNSVLVYNCDFRTTGGTMGTNTSIINTSCNAGQSSSLEFNGFFLNNSATSGYGTIDTKGLLYRESANPGATNDIKISQFVINSPAAGFSYTGVGFDLDGQMTAAGYGQVTAFAEYRYNKGRARTVGCTVVAPNTTVDFTLHGSHRDALVVFANALTADRKCIVNQFRTPAGLGSTSPRDTGDLPRVYRASSATGAFNINVVSSLATGTNVAQLTAVNTETQVAWNGTALVTA